MKVRLAVYLKISPLLNIHGKPNNFDSLQKHHFSQFLCQKQMMPISRHGFILILRFLWRVRPCREKLFARPLFRSCCLFRAVTGLELNRTYAPVWDNRLEGIPPALVESFPELAGLMNALMECAMPRLSALLVHRCSGMDTSIRELDLRKLNIGDHKLFKLAHALRFNTSVRKLDLRDNNISAKMMLLFVQLVGTHNFDILELNFDEGMKTLADKSQLNWNLGSLRKAKIEAVRAVLEIATPHNSEDETRFFANLVLPAVDRFVSVNRSIAAVRAWYFIF